MSVIGRSSLLSFCLLLTLLGGSAGNKYVSEAAVSGESTQFVEEPQAELLRETGNTKPVVREASNSVKVSQNRVKVFFPNPSKNRDDSSYVEPVWRTTQRRDLARFAIEQVIAGPTPDEISMGFVKPIQFSSASNCGSDFRLSISGGLVRFQFCRTISSPGIGYDAAYSSSIEATLKQFPTIKSVIIRNENGFCPADAECKPR